MRGAQTGATLGAIVSVPYYYSYLKGSNTLWKTIGNGSLFFMVIPFYWKKKKQKKKKKHLSWKK